jgi:hypothetical protein
MLKDFCHQVGEMCALGVGGSGIDRLAATPNSLRGQREENVNGEYRVRAHELANPEPRGMTWQRKQL